MPKKTPSVRGKVLPKQYGRSAGENGVRDGWEGRKTDEEGKDLFYSKF